MKTKGMVNTKTRRTVYLRVIKGDDYIVAGSLKPVVWSDEFEPADEDDNEYQTLVTEVPPSLAKQLETMGDENQFFSDGYVAYNRARKYLKHAGVI